jgi:hypothetical protein
MLLPVAVSVLSEIAALLLTYHQAEFDVFNGELKWSIDLASSCSAA